MVPRFQRARSPAAREAAEEAILDAARDLAAERRVRSVTLTAVAEMIGMHKSALLRYFETREGDPLLLTREGWQEWSPQLQHDLRSLRKPTPASVARVFARTLAARGLFCDLLAHTPLNLERNVSLDAIREFKLATHAEVEAIIEVVREMLPILNEDGALDLISATTALAGSLWQIATPGPEVAALYRSDPRLALAVVDFEPRLARILTRLLEGSARR